MSHPMRHFIRVNSVCQNNMRSTFILPVVVDVLAVIISDCSGLNTPVHGSLSWSNGHNVTVSCDPGYKLLGERVLVCFLGSWSGRVGVCAVDNDCSGLIAPVHGFLSSNFTSHGGHVTVSCDRGYELSGERIIECSSGSWSGNVGVCVVEKDCSGLQKPVHGSLSWSNGRNVTVSCDPGYKLSGERIIVCSLGSWSGYVGVCVVDKELSDCSGLVAPVHGSLSSNFASHGGHVTVSCDSGYELSGETILVCSLGSWSGNVGACVLKKELSDCSGLVAPVHGSLSSIFASHGGHVTVSCDSGYELSGETILVCSLGSWSGNVGACVLKKELSDCSGLIAPVHGSLSSNSALHGGNVSVSCDSGYELSGETILVCSLGSWSGNVGACVVKKDYQGKTFFLALMPHYLRLYNSLPIKMKIITNEAGTVQVIMPNRKTYTFSLTSKVTEVSVPASLVRVLAIGIGNKGIEIKSTVDVAIYVVELDTVAYHGTVMPLVPVINSAKVFVVQSYETNYYSPKSHFVIIATEYSTDVNITLKTLSPGNVTYKNMIFKDGDIVRISLNRLQTFYAYLRTNDLSGSLIESNKPIAVFSGADTVGIPKDIAYGNIIESQMIPVSQWGFVYVVPTIYPGQCHVRVFAFHNATHISVNAKFDLDRNITLNQGEFWETTLYGSQAQPLFISSDTAISVVLYGSTIGFLDNDRSNPFMLVVPDIYQYSTLATTFSTMLYSDPDDLLNKKPFENYAAIVLLDTSYNQLQYNGKAPEILRSYSVLNDYTVVITPLNNVTTHTISTVKTSTSIPMAVFVYGMASREAYGFVAGFHSTNADCGGLTAPVHGSLSSNFTTHGGSVIVSCNLGFELSGERILVCSWGSWSGNVGTCVMTEGCSALISPVHGSLSSNDASHGRHVAVSCDPGYILLGDRVLVCSTGSWSGNVGACVEEEGYQGKTFYFASMPSSWDLIDVHLKIISSEAGTIQVIIPTLDINTIYSLTPKVTDISIHHPKLRTDAIGIDSKGMQIVSTVAVNIYVVEGDILFGVCKVMQVMPVISSAKLFIVQSYKSDRYWCKSHFIIIATEDATDVSITLKTAFPGNVTYSNIVYKDGDIINVTINQLQTFYIYIFANDLSGSLIESNKPIAVFSGADIISIPNTWTSDSNVIESQMTPVSQWGNVYIIPPIYQARFLVRVFAFYNATNISLNDKLDLDNNFTLNHGEFWETTLYDPQAQPLVISSNLAISVVLYGARHPFMLVVPVIHLYSTSAITFPTLQYGDVDDYPKESLFENYAAIVSEASIDQLQYNGMTSDILQNYNVMNKYTVVIIKLKNETSHTISTVNTYTSLPTAVFVYGVTMFESYGFVPGFRFINADCSGLIAPEHGSLSSNNASPGRHVTVSCDPGYILLGDRVLVCSLGSWSGNVGACVVDKGPTKEDIIPATGIIIGAVIGFITIASLTGLIVACKCAKAPTTVGIQ